MIRRKNFKYISLFAGCGGFDDGFTQAGLKCIGAYDIDPNVIKVHKTNIGGPAFVHDLSNICLPGDIKSGCVDVVISGSPCQGFSTIGKRDVKDPRNELLLVGGKVAINLGARVFVAENVMGSTAGQHRKYWEDLEKLLTDNNYNIRKITCDVSKLGMAQLRKRIILIAWKGDKNIEFNLPIVPGQVLRDVLTNLSGLENHDVGSCTVNGNILSIAKHIKAGQKLSNVRGGERSVHTWDIPEVFGRTTKKEKELLLTLMRLRRQLRIRELGDSDPVLVSDLQKRIDSPVRELLESLNKKGYIKSVGRYRYDLTNSFNGKYRRLSWDSPSPTVDTRFGDPKYFLHPSENRGFTPREAARIQGFRDNFIFTGTVEQQFRMIGNAVPPPLGFQLASLIVNNILDK